MWPIDGHHSVGSAFNGFYYFRFLKNAREKQSSINDNCNIDIWQINRNNYYNTCMKLPQLMVGFLPKFTKPSRSFENMYTLIDEMLTDNITPILLE